VKKVLVVCGATATGKTSLAVELALALHTEIISADSQLVYQGLNVGTAKPTLLERKNVPHHMIDVVSPKQTFSVSDYEEQALPLVKRLLDEGKNPIICGGTGFYINSLLFNLTYGGASANEEIRRKYEGILQEKGKKYLFAELEKADPQTAQKLHVNDTKRVIRALEIYEQTGKKKSEQHDEYVPRFPYVAVAIDYPREELYQRIDSRVDEMFGQGLVQEVKKLLASGVTETDQCLQAIGYKEVVECLKNGKNESTMRDIIKKNTRHYAKRQITFFKKLPQIVWLKPSDATPQKVMELL
jgi:tRNA dimethylallyltransferase